MQNYVRRLPYNFCAVFEPPCARLPLREPSIVDCKPSPLKKTPPTNAKHFLINSRCVCERLGSFNYLIIALNWLANVYQPPLNARRNYVH